MRKGFVFGIGQYRQAPGCPSWLSARFAVIPVLAVLLLLMALPASAQETEPSGKNPLVDQADALIQEMKQITEEAREHEVTLGSLEGDEKIVAERLVMQKRLDLLARVGTLVENVLEQEKEGLDASAYRTRIGELLIQIPPAIRKYIGILNEQVKEARAAEESAEPEDRIALRTQIADSSEQVNPMYRALLDNIGRMKSMGLDYAEEVTLLEKQLKDRSEIVAGYLQLAGERRDIAQGIAEASPEDAELQSALRTAEKELEEMTSSLTNIVQMMDEIGLETTKYQELLFTTTGDITPDILDSEVIIGLLGRWTTRAKEWLQAQGPLILFKLLLFLAIMTAFRVLAALIGRLIKRAVSTSRVKLSKLMRDTIVSWGSKTVMLLGVMVALSQLGVSIGPLLAGLGIAGFIVGFALQETLANFASGMMILAYRPYDVDDLIEAAGAFGKVQNMSLVSTTILTLNHETLVVPNGKIWGNVIRNITAQPKRRVDLKFGISYDDSIPKAEKIFNDILSEHPKVLKEPKPLVKLHNLGDSAVEFIVWPWVETPDYWDVYWDVIREVKMRLDREGISIPYPQRDIHLYQSTSGAKPGPNQS